MSLKPRTFGLQVGGVLALLGLLPILWGGQLRAVLLAPAALLIGAAVVWPSSLTLLSRGWMALSQLLERLTSPVLLRVLYYVVVVPFAALTRADSRVGWQPAPSWQAPPRPSTNEVGLLAEVLFLLRTRKRLWLLPMVVVLLVLGGLFLLAEGTALLPFLYPLF